MTVQRASPAEIAFQAAALMLALALPTLVALLSDTRVLDGVSVWDKPLKFEVSLALHLATLGVLSSLFTAQVRESRCVIGLYVTSACASLGEIAYIALQAARGRHSHFNYSTGIEGFMYGMMGFGATTLVVCAFLIGWLIAKEVRPGIGRGLQRGAAWGLMLGAVGTLCTAGIMSTGLVSGLGHWIGGAHSDAGGLPLTGWSTGGGDLRVPHFFATHAMQALPLIGLLADRWVPARAAPAVNVAAWIAGAVVVLTLVQALLGQPFIRLT